MDWIEIDKTDAVTATPYTNPINFNWGSKTPIKTKKYRLRFAEKHVTPYIADLQIVYEDLGYEADDLPCKLEQNEEGMCNEFGECPEFCGETGFCCSPDHNIADPNTGCGVDATSAISPSITYPVCVRPKEGFYYEPILGQSQLILKIIEADN